MHIVPKMAFRVIAGFGRRLVNLNSKAQRGEIDLTGDRDIEWSWVVAKLGNAPSKVLDFGGGLSGFLSLTSARRGFEVVALDREAMRWPFVEPNITFIQNDILKVNFPAATFDLVINCSTVEHVGLSGRYGTAVDVEDGDIQAMGILRGLLKPDGAMLLTIPVGSDAVFSPDHRVYGQERLPLLLHGYMVEEEEFWAKDAQNRWVKTGKENALASKSQKRLYGLGCFVLRVFDERKE